ncbi:RHS repeat-associated core domain-containing protein [Brumimicrobium mesophilum]|uniref:RHS repeat-associated core domain-containing protein n=1 Tax=Brumimicrobium mesophilum TaxID=392717 RepID=UPI000D13F0AF|nr:RHS repeat-associated core domain-containing protein [Brumimicrobium mesophilum]
MLSLGSYRYGFNGMEKDDKIKGEGNSLDFGARIYDPRVGRWLSTDPLESEYIDQSPYNFVANNPIGHKDPDGERIIVPMRLNGGLFGWFKVRMQIAFRKRNDPVFADQFAKDRKDNNLHIYRSTSYSGNGSGRHDDASWTKPTIIKVDESVVERVGRYNRLAKRLQRKSKRKPGGSSSSIQVNYEYRPTDYVTGINNDVEGIPNTEGQDFKTINSFVSSGFQSFSITGDNRPIGDRIQISDNNGNILFDTANLPGANANGEVSNSYTSGIINVPSGTNKLNITVNGNSPSPGSRFSYRITTTENTSREGTTTKEARKMSRKGQVVFEKP